MFARARRHHQRHHAQDEGQRSHQRSDAAGFLPLLPRLPAAACRRAAIARRIPRSEWRSCWTVPPASPVRSGSRRHSPVRATTAPTMRSQQRHRNRQQHDEGQNKTFILGGKRQVHHQRAQAEQNQRGASRTQFFERQPGPLEAVALRQDFLAQLLHGVQAPVRN